MQESVSIGEQVTFALSNIERITQVVGAGREDVVKCTVFVTGIEYWPEANRAYAAFFGEHKPARSIVPCLALHYGAKVEIEAVIAVGGVRGRVVGDAKRLEDPRGLNPALR